MRVQSRRIALGAAAIAVVLAFGLTMAHAQVADHLKCYKIKDPVKLAAVVDLDSPQFGLEAGCKVTSAKMFCVPATKTVISAVDKATGLPITPLPVTGPDPGDRICYKVKCPEPFPPDTQATDQFGTRTLTKFKPFMLCAPAVKGGVPLPRFVDNGDGTVTDNVTGLQWEKKTDDGGVHDVDNTYTWTSSGSPYPPDGTAFTVFLANLNTEPCFAGHCDWRLPKVNRDGDPAELETILLAPYPCGTSPCIDPIFGTTAPAYYWSATTSTSYPGGAWLVYFYDGFVSIDYGWYTYPVRAVRSGP